MITARCYILLSDKHQLFLEKELKLLKFAYQMRLN